jgi:hypothetical protein
MTDTLLENSKASSAFAVPDDKLILCPTRRFDTEEEL